MATTTSRKLTLPDLCPRCAAVPGREGDDAAAEWITAYETTSYVHYGVVGIRLDELGEPEAIENEAAEVDPSDEAAFYPERPMGSKHGQIIRDRNCGAAFLVTLDTWGVLMLLATDDADLEYTGH